MKIKPYIDKLNNSKEYKDFVKKNADAYLMAGFFVIDLETKKNIHQIDYFVPSKKKVAAFTLDNHVTVQMLETMNNNKPGKLDLNTNIDLDALAGILGDEMKNRSITDEIKKIVAVIQQIDGKRIWNLNCVLSGMNILKAHIEDDSKTVIKMEKASIMDYIQKMPGNLGANMKKGMGMPGMQMSQPQPMPGAAAESEESGSPMGQPAGVATKPSPQAIKDEIMKLDKLEQAIKKEKEILAIEVEKQEKSKKGKDKTSKAKDPKKKK